MAQLHTLLGVIPFWGLFWIACKKKEMLHRTSEKVEIYLWKIGFEDCIFGLQSGAAEFDTGKRRETKQLPRRLPGWGCLGAV